MTWEIPDRDSWFKIESRKGTYYFDREHWCRDNCQGRWIMNLMTAEFESEKDAVTFALVWG